MSKIKTFIVIVGCGQGGRELLEKHEGTVFDLRGHEPYNQSGLVRDMLIDLDSSFADEKRFEVWELGDFTSEVNNQSMEDFSGCFIGYVTSVY